MPTVMLPDEMFTPDLSATRASATVEPDLRYAHDPIGWMVKVLGANETHIRWSKLGPYAKHDWDGTPDPLVAIAEGVAAGQDVGVESATNVGKTYFLSELALWFLSCHKDALVITVAPKEDQLKLQLWKEMGRQWKRFERRFPIAEFHHLRVYMKPEAPERDAWAIIGYAVGVEAGQVTAVRAHGFHAEHMLIIHEETPGIDPAVMAALALTCTGSHNVRVAVGNPDHQQDTLHRFCTRQSALHVRISAYDHPNVVCRGEIVPAAVTPRGIRVMAEDWGEGSAMYDSRARGISPAQASDSLIKRAWLESAAKAWLETQQATRFNPTALGVDVAQSENGDKAGIALWRGNRLEAVEVFACPDATQLGVEVLGHMSLQRVSADHVGVDPVGVGAATLNFLRRQPGGYDVQALNGGLKPVVQSARAPDGSSYDWAPDANNFLNLRSQMWWQLREDLRLGQVAMPENEMLWKELTLVTYRTHNGKAQIEPKDELKKRLGRSPDAADAVVYGNWVRPRAPAPERVRPEDFAGRDPMLAAQLARDGLRIDGSNLPEDEWPTLPGLSHGF